MDEKTMVEFQKLLKTLDDERGRIGELAHIIGQKVSIFRGIDLFSESLKKEDVPKRPGLIGNFYDVTDIIKEHRIKLEIIVKELSELV